MSNIVVNTDQLTNYGNSLETKAQNFNSLRTSMEEIISSISGSWEGSDSRTFITKATAYLHNLAVVENALNAYAGSVKNHSVKYNNRCADFYDRLG